MIVKILSSTASFSAVSYNTSKIDRNRGELMKTANFGPLQALHDLRPSDYVNYLRLISAQNKRIVKPQFHAVISAKGKSCSKEMLTGIADKWLVEMGYDKQPYLIVYHKDTENNHVHIVSTRVDKTGAKISSAFERLRAISSLRKVLGYEYADKYNISTKAQYLTLLENSGYPATEPPEKNIRERITASRFDPRRAAELKALFLLIRTDPAFAEKLHDQHSIDLVFHAAENQRPYGYTVIDHLSNSVYKGSEIMSLKQLLSDGTVLPQGGSYEPAVDDREYLPTLILQSIQISDDVDDQQIHGMRRKRQKKARTNTR
jgi:hypothetical protein